MIFAGLFFLAVALVFLLVLSGKLQKLSGNAIDAGLGMLLVFVSYGALSIVAGSFSPGGIAAYFASSFTLPLLIPLLLFAVGLLMLVRSLFSKWIKRKEES